MSTNAIYLIVIGLIFWGSFGAYCLVCSRNERRDSERAEEIRRLEEICQL